MAQTKIEWATRVWNPVTGCSPVSSGCDHCYAARMANRLKSNPKAGKKYCNGFSPTFHWEEITAPSKWRTPQRVFVCSMGDLFHASIEFSDIIDVCHCIRAFPQHTFIILTKRPERAYEFFCDCAFNPYGFPYDPLPNLWLGVSVEDQATADERIPILLQIPAAIRLISAEPLLGPIQLPENSFRDSMDNPGGPLNWIIAGGETGPGARPMHPDWVRSLRDQADDAGVPFFFKSWGEYAPFEETAQQPFYRDVRNGVEHDAHQLNFIDPITGAAGKWRGCKWFDILSFADYLCSHCMYLKVGKKYSGDLLDGQQYHQFPIPKL